MELAKALKRVLKFCPGKKEKTLYDYVRFYAPKDDQNPMISATDGFSTCTVELEVPVPDLLLEAGMLKKASKESKTLEVHVTGFGHVELRTDVATYKMESAPFDQYPMLPQFPVPGVTADLTLEWPYILKTIHAAAKTGNMSVLHLTDRYVEAGDKSRFARVSVRGAGDGIAPIKTFTAWPKGAVKVTYSPSHIFIQVEEEMRIGMLLDNDYPDTEKLIPENYPAGKEVIVNTDTISEVVKRGTDVSALKLLRLRIQENEIHVYACSSKADVEPVYVATIPILHNYIEDGQVVVNGKFLEQALKQVKTVNCWLGYASERDPLRIESGCYQNVIWQVIL